MRSGRERSREPVTRRAARSAASSLAVVVVVAAAPDAAADVKLELGARTGFALPSGDVTGEGENEAKLRGLAVGQVPLWLDLGARMGRYAFAGAYVQYGVAVHGDDFRSFCDGLDRSYRDEGGSASCQLHDFRVGAQFQYHFGPIARRYEPWAGVGFGYEWLSAGVFVHGAEGSADHAATVHGFELVNLQAGLDVPMTDTMWLGPFVAFTVGSYERIARSCAGSLCAENDDGLERVQESVLHEWIYFGVRAEFLP